MKKLLGAALFTSILFCIFSCSKDDDDINLDDHDSNRMMDTMHVMMSKMDTMHMTNDPDIDFAMMMKMHHMGAISMANLELQEGKNNSMKTTAQHIIDMQQQEIQELNTILASITPDKPDPEFTVEQKSNMEKMGKTADVQLITGDIDNDFATLMIIHHQAALDNASAYLHHGSHDGLKMMANSMITMQSQEIKDLSSWLITNRR